MVRRRHATRCDGRIRLATEKESTNLGKSVELTYDN